MGRVLLIDDDPIQLQVREAILRDAGLEVFVATTADSALALLRTESIGDSFKAIVTDHIMPGCSGAVFVRALREIKPKIPVVVVSGLPDAEDEYGELNVSFLQKPCPPPDLISLIQRLINQNN